MKRKILAIATLFMMGFGGFIGYTTNPYTYTVGNALWEIKALDATSTSRPDKPNKIGGCSSTSPNLVH